MASPWMPSGKGLDFCGYIGGSLYDSVFGVAVDTAGNFLVVGSTSSSQQTFPVKQGPDLTFNGGTYDGFVAMIRTIVISGSGTNRPGGSVSLALHASQGANLVYVAGTSLGTGPIAIGKRTLRLRLDDLLIISISNNWPAVFSGFRGRLDSKGQARATINIPDLTALIGVRLHSAFVTLDPSAPSGIRSISNTFSFSITK